MPSEVKKGSVSAKKILFYSENPAVVSSLETIFDILDVNFFTATSLESLQEIISTHDDFLAYLLYADNQATIENIFDLTNRSLSEVPLYLLRPEDSQGYDISNYDFSGIFTYPIKYNQLQAVMQIAEIEKGKRRPRKRAQTLTVCSPQMKEIQTLIQHVSITDANVLILGESGTGKEVVARSIHNLSPRNAQPFVAVNCGAIPPDLLESELFGHEKGSFTGALNKRIGRFELAEGGTLFLDEIGDMPYDMQVKLLRVIQEKTFQRLGGVQSITSNVRIVAATHQDLQKSIVECKFRMDLYYRLNVFPIELEPLRNRPEDIEFFLHEFSKKMELEYGRIINFDDSAVQTLKTHPLPGNVRELENLVERLAILYPGETISKSKLPVHYQQGSNSENLSVAKSSTLTIAPSPPEITKVENLKEYMTTLEKSIIEKALSESNGIVAKAAKSLSLRRTTLVEKIRKLEIQQSA